MATPDQIATGVILGVFAGLMLFFIISFVVCWLINIWANPYELWHDEKPTGSGDGQKLL